MKRVQTATTFRHDEVQAACLVARQMKRPRRPKGEPVPEHRSVFRVDEVVTVKNYTFRVAYIGEGTLLLEPVGPLLVEPEGA